MLEIGFMIYGALILVFLFVSSFINGYMGADFKKKDLIESVFWPVTLCELLGALIKILIERKK